MKFTFNTRHLVKYLLRQQKCLPKGKKAIGILLMHFTFIQLIGAEGDDSCGKAHNVRRNKPRVARVAAYVCARGKRPPAAEINGRIYLYKKAISNETAFIYHFKFLCKNAFVRSCFGFVKNTSGWFASMMSPPSIKTTLFATSRAKPISCVTTIIVI